MGDEPLVDRLRGFLRDLKPEAQALLIAELERSLLRGEEATGAELVLGELRRFARESGRPSPRAGNLARLFFQPLEPFLVDDAATHKHPGRIARVSLDPIWTWIGRDLLPGEVKAATEQVAKAHAANDSKKADEVARAFQDRVAVRMEQALNAAWQDDKAMRRLVGQVSTPRALEDLQAILKVLQSRDKLAAFSARVPGHIKNFSDEMVDDVKALIESPVGGGSPLFLYVLVIVMHRLAAPWQLIRLATRAAGSDSAARIAETQYEITVSMVLSEMERMVGELKAELRSGKGVAVGALLKSIHDAARGLRTEINLSTDSPWGRELSAIRTEISNMLKAEIDSLPGRVRRLLRPRPAKEITSASKIDLTDVAETEALIEFVGTCRQYAGELAINEMTQRVYSDVQNYLDTSTQPLIDALRGAGEADQAFRHAQVEAAARFCAKVFGEDYAATLQKAADLAIQGERKVAKG
jgi:hypothetical protein